MNLKISVSFSERGLTKLWECVKYLAFISAFGFVIGRIIPGHWMQWDKRPFKLWDFENDGKIYNCLKIRKWQNKLPDMSKIFKHIMPEKKMPESLSEEAVTVMLRETCIAELIHVFLCLAGLYCMSIWSGSGGRIVAAAYLLGNIPFILIQRFNRPKFEKVLRRIRKNSLPLYNSRECHLCEF